MSSVSQEVGANRASWNIDGGPPYGIELDTLASMARTAITDPLGVGLPDSMDRAVCEALGKSAAEIEAENECYAVDRMDEIIEILNPSTETMVTMARALRVLGRHIAEVASTIQACANSDQVPEECEQYASAAYYCELSLDRLDEAISALEGTDTDA